MSKNARISESVFGRPQNWETFRYLSNFKISEVVKKFDSKSNEFEVTKLFPEGIFYEKAREGHFCSPLPQA